MKLLIGLRGLRSKLEVVNLFVCFELKKEKGLNLDLLTILDVTGISSAILSLESECSVTNLHHREYL